MQLKNVKFLMLLHKNFYSLQFNLLIAKILKDANFCLKSLNLKCSYPKQISLLFEYNNWTALLTSV